MDEKIDLVITWVDGSDPKWLEEKNKYVSNFDSQNPSTGGADRYEDNDLLQYLFRGIEKFAPWVNKIHFVTWGHLPKWLNTNNSRINIVNHKDFIPEIYLPTFNSATINLNLHRIPGISDKFIYFNDDMFILDYLKPTLFFKNSKPCDMFVNDIVDTSVYHDNYNYTVINDLCLLNKISKKKDFYKHNFSKVYSLKYGFKNLYKNFILRHYRLFTGIIEPHTPASYNKKNYEEIWEKFGKELDLVCKDKVRTHFSCTENLIRYYQMTSGNFVPINRNKFGTYTTSSSRNIEKIFTNKKYKLVCINYVKKENIDKLRSLFNEILPAKSTFEK